MARKTKYIQNAMDVAVKRLLKEKYGIDVRIQQDGRVHGFPNDPSDNQYHNKYLVTLEGDGRTYKFPFYGSAAYYPNQHHSLWEMVSAAVTDVTFLESEGIGSAQELAESIYGENYYENKERFDTLYYSLVDTRDKMNRIGLSDDDIWDIGYRLNEWENDGLYEQPVPRG